MKKVIKTIQSPTKILGITVSIIFMIFAYTIVKPVYDRLTSTDKPIQEAGNIVGDFTSQAKKAYEDAKKDRKDLEDRFNKKHDLMQKKHAAEIEQVKQAATQAVDKKIAELNKMYADDKADLNRLKKAPSYSDEEIAIARENSEQISSLRNGLYTGIAVVIAGFVYTIFFKK